MSKYCPWQDACEEALNAEAEIERLQLQVVRLRVKIEELQELWHENAKTATNTTTPDRNQK